MEELVQTLSADLSEQMELLSLTLSDAFCKTCKPSCTKLNTVRQLINKIEQTTAISPPMLHTTFVGLTDLFLEKCEGFSHSSKQFLLIYITEKATGSDNIPTVPSLFTLCQLTVRWKPLYL